MNIAKFAVDSAISHYMERDFVSYYKMSKETGVAAATLKKQISGESKNMRAETFFRIVQALGTLEIDPSEGTMTIRMKKSKDVSRSLAKFKNREIKKRM